MRSSRCYMPKKIDQLTIDKAKLLKAQGKNNEEIHLLTGVSIGWCKKHLSSENLGTKEVYEKMYKKSKTKQGLSKAEIAHELSLYDLPSKEFSSEMQKTVRRVRANNKDNVVRPNWMHPSFASFVTNKVVETSMTLEERCHEEASELCTIMRSSCNEDDLKLMPSVQQVKAAMLGLASASTAQRADSTSRLTSWMYSLSTTADKLSKRNKQTKLDETAGKIYSGIDASDMEDFMY